MASQEDHASNQLPTFGSSPHAEILSSKFLRKTKFRRKSGANFQQETSSAPDEAAVLDGEPPASITLGEGTPASPSSPEKKSFDNPDTGSDVSSTASTPKEAADEPGPPPSSMSSLSDAASALSHPPSTASSTPANEIAAPMTSPPTVISPRSSSTETDSASETEPLSFTLSPEELDQAKILVLDLLGWGVDAEYLVTSGVSPAVIFRVFTDLNLQLPTNLEVSDELTAVAYSWGPCPELSKSTEPTSVAVE
ncbi:hypothetical protein M413DRAFT_146385 [Hebeloma cylindrosporum]|uniref:Uncharacterized protein n=1 Tax=Hebeloma cylindrosporum TaxID=76867 RepID=A0A0C2XUI9_HEBCY|nr:hypothetical protein M413DRAFT_146385 [Hebeloma cylindrosporum h7]